jgi:hypothetical protein
MSKHYFSCSGGPYAVFIKKHDVTRYTELVFWHTVGSVGHVVHSSMSGHETSMHYFSRLCGPDGVSIKSAPGYITSKLYFYI